MFIEEKMNVITNNDILKQFYSTEYVLYKEELKKELDRQVKYNFEKGMF